MRYRCPSNLAALAVCCDPALKCMRPCPTYHVGFAGELVVSAQARQVPAQRSERRQRPRAHRAHLCRQH